MKEERKIEHTIRGPFYVIELTKEYKGMPGFSPDYYDKVVGRVVVKFRDEPPYFQTSDETHLVLNISDINQIMSLMSKGFIESEFTQ